MRLWVLKRLTEQPVYDVNNGFVIRASDPYEARMIATRYACDEGKDVWLSRDTSSCEELLQSGEAGLIMLDFNAG